MDYISNVLDLTIALFPNAENRQVGNSADTLIAIINAQWGFFDTIHFCT